MKVKKLLVLSQKNFTSNFYIYYPVITKWKSLLEVFADLLKIKEQKYDMFITIDIDDTQNRAEVHLISTDHLLDGVYLW